MRTLISWLAYNNDFHRGGEKGPLKGVNKEGPNYSMHKYFWSYDRHILLYSGIGDEAGAEMLKNEIIREFPEHKIEIVNANIKDPINLAEIKPVVEARLLDIEGDEIDIFASPGTPTMQVAWYICHTTLKLKTRILQMRPPDKAKTGKRELIEMKIEQSPTPVTAVIKEK
ncbi:MAG TPA: RNA repair transcriptional activator RtcR family protein, partial [Bacteroidales bacterium]|nr:RNA repair transcriptional activator RtcR family protein [Bacteroidales bacterium]HRT48718.1 RNA repair transcriptional activator RtcR family protein [Bacteroidales bacterium]